MSDLTERLAAKLEAASLVVRITFLGTTVQYTRVDWADRLLPLLLSEPELVASLSDEVRRSVLTPRERAVMKLGEATLVLHAADDEQFGAAIARRDIALEAARALPPSPAPMEGRSNDNK